VTTHRFEAILWVYDGDAPWHFVTVPAELADDIAAAAEPKAFGSVPVRVRIGGTSWATSLFPDKGSGSYVLPVKRAVRDTESLDDGDVVAVELSW
jgi:hypothetical protein